MLKVLSWLRSKPEADEAASGSDDAFRLDRPAPPARPAPAERRPVERKPAERAPVERQPAEYDSRDPHLERRAYAEPAPRPAPAPRSAPAQPRQAPPPPPLQPQQYQPAPARDPREQYAEPRRAPQAQPSQRAPQPQPQYQSRPQARIEPRKGTLGASGLSKTYGTRKVVRDVSIHLRRGEAVGLLGPNGAGKTTVFYMIVGLVAADEGRISLDGFDVTGLPMYRRARLGIGYLPQEASIFRGLSVEDNIMSVLEVIEPDKRKREHELNSLLEEFKITHVRKSPSIALSGGERRRCEIARSLATRPSFMLLDEPFAGIDPIAVGDIRTLVRHLTTRGIGVLITDHNVRETLGLVDRAYIVHSGTILMEGTPDEIVDNPDVRRLYLGEEFRL